MTQIDLTKIDPDDLDTADVEMMVNQIRPLLSGKSPPLIGAALANLLATWLASHTTFDKREDAGLREKMLAMHVKMVRAMIPLEHLRIHAEAAKRPN